MTEQYRHANSKGVQEDFQDANKCQSAVCPMRMGIVTKRSCDESGRDEDGR